MKQKPMRRVVLLANGVLLEPGYIRSLLEPEDTIIAANGGTRLARVLGRVPDLLIGDGDSLPVPLQQWLEAHQVPHHVHSREKDATDLELALRHAIALGASSLLLIGVTGERIDHTLANISLLALARDAGIPAEVVVGQQHIFLVYDQIFLRGAPGQTVSLIPWGGDARGVSTEGFTWELQNEDLLFGPARGISNLMAAAEARITLQSGMLLVCQQRGEVR